MSSTRGVKKLKSYLGANEPILSRAKTAKDVAPVLMQKALKERTKLQTSKSLQGLTDHDVSNDSSNKNKNIADATNTDKGVTQGQEQHEEEVLMNDINTFDSNPSLSSPVLWYLRQYCVQSTENNTPAIHSISKKQLQLVQSLGGNTYNANNSSSEGEAAHITIKRACLHNVDAIADTLALAALQRANAGANNGLEQSTIFVLIEDVPSALSLRRTFVDKYKLHVLLLASEEEKTQYATIIAQEAKLDAHDKGHDNEKNNNVSTDDGHSAMSRARQNAMTDSCSSRNSNSIVDTNRFPTFPYAKKDNNNSKVSVTPERFTYTRAMVSRQHKSYHTVIAKTNKHHATHHDQQEELENRNENDVYKANMSSVEHNDKEEEDIDKDKAEMLNNVQEPVVIVLATPGVMTTVDKRSAL